MLIPSQQLLRLAALSLLGWSHPAVAGTWAERPLAFEENRGQADARARFIAREPGFTLFLTSSEAVVAPRGGGPPLRLRWLGARREARSAAQEELPGRTHYLLGKDAATWRIGIRSYARVRYRGVYPGIDLVFYGNPRQLEHDFIVAPGADPRAIRLAVEGTERLEIDAAGDLVLDTAGAVRLRKPVSYQERGGRRREVASRWRLLPGGTLGFELGAYDPDRPLVIDPVFVYSTYLGGSQHDTAFAVAADAAGNAYVAGHTSSADFPVLGPIQALRRQDAFVAKLDPAGGLLWATYLGGSGGDAAFGVGVDAAGAVYVTGHTDSSDFPRVATSLPSPPVVGTTDVFLAKLDPTGSALLWSAAVGGSHSDEVRGLATDPAGNVYVAGGTQSADFPVQAALQPVSGGPTDAFLMKLTAAGQLVYSTYLGGAGTDYAWGVAADPAGHAYVVGETTFGRFPTVSAAQPEPPGEQDAFAARLSPAGDAVIWATYLGGTREDRGQGIAADAAGNAYVVGQTQSLDFPTRDPFQAELNVTPDLFLPDAFVTKFDPSGEIAYSTYLGGGHVEWGQAVAVDARGSAYVTGGTESPDFPVRHAPQPECQPGPEHFCALEGFVAQLSPAGDALVWATFLGGSVYSPESTIQEDEPFGIALDPVGNSYVVGTTATVDFPTVSAFQPALAGQLDAYVTKISAANRPPDCAGAGATPALLWPPDNKLRAVSLQGIADPDGDPVSLTVTGVRQDEPLMRKGEPDAAGVGTAAVQLRAARHGAGDGRVYHVAFAARDPLGAACAGAVVVCVPRDAKRRTCGDGGALFDSTARR